MPRKLDVVIVGGGLVGSLTACFMAKRGHNVRVYEYRSDIRMNGSKGVSINLALSDRGRLALRSIGLEDAVVKNHGSAMKSRMLHLKNGSLKEIAYDPVNNNCIYSVNRNFLNQLLLDAAEKNCNVTLIFDRKLIDSELQNGKLKFLNTNTKEIEDVTADLIVGADGAYSATRRFLMKNPLFDFQQKYIEHGYVEITVPSSKNGEYAIARNVLHIWPRGDFMMIALPNNDRSFTGNIFAPFKTLEALDTPERLMQFFRYQFPDAVSLIDKDQLLTNFFESKPKTLISIKCKPYHVGSKAVLVGDAAHAMVPFYAMGMNTGFEDVLLLDELMELHDSDLEKVLPHFSALRCENAHAMCDLAMYNYVEMRDLVTKNTFLVRKFLDSLLFWMFPNTWIPLYSSVHFSRMPFKECVSNKAWQDKVIRAILAGIGVAVMAVIIKSEELNHRIHQAPNAKWWLETRDSKWCLGMADDSKRRGRSDPNED